MQCVRSGELFFTLLQVQRWAETVKVALVQSITHGAASNMKRHCQKFWCIASSKASTSLQWTQFLIVHTSGVSGQLDFSRSTNFLPDLSSWPLQCSSSKSSGLNFSLLDSSNLFRQALSICCDTLCWDSLIYRKLEQGFSTSGSGQRRREVRELLLNELEKEE